MQNARDDGAKSNARDDYARLKQAYQDEEAKLDDMLTETGDLEASERKDDLRLKEIQSKQQQFKDIYARLLPQRDETARAMRTAKEDLQKAEEKRQFLLNAIKELQQEVADVEASIPDLKHKQQETYTRNKTEAKTVAQMHIDSDKHNSDIKQLSKDATQRAKKLDQLRKETHLQITKVERMSSELQAARNALRGATQHNASFSKGTGPSSNSDSSSGTETSSSSSSNSGSSSSTAPSSSSSSSSNTTSGPNASSSRHSNGSSYDSRSGSSSSQSQATRNTTSSSSETKAFTTRKKNPYTNSNEQERAREMGFPRDVYNEIFAWAKKSNSCAFMCLGRECRAANCNYSHDHSYKDQWWYTGDTFHRQDNRDVPMRNLWDGSEAQKQYQDSQARRTGADR